MTPDLTVVLAAPGGLASIAATLRHLRAQTVRARIEIVVVAAEDAAAFADASSFAGFAGHRFVRLAEIRSRAAANAAGSHHAGAEVVAFAEDHCFPEPEWAEAILRRHAEPWAAVGPEIVNANPASLLGWCDFLVNYAAWAAPARGGEAAELPGHNTSYKRSVLESHGAALDAWLEVEGEMHRALRLRGQRLYLESEAKVRHHNITRPTAWVTASFHGGRVYAAARAKDWRRPRRLAYGAAWPLIAVLRLLRQRWPVAAPSRLRLAPLLFVGLLIDAAGQAVGYLAGAGNARGHMARIDFGRARDGTSSESVERSSIAS